MKVPPSPTSLSDNIIGFLAVAEVTVVGPKLEKLFMLTLFATCN